MFLSPTANGPQRVQGCYVGEREIDRVSDFWREQYADEERVPAPWEITKVQHLEEIAQAGADTFVSGSGIFGGASDSDPNRYNTIVKKMRDELAKVK